MSDLHSRTLILLSRLPALAALSALVGCSSPSGIPSDGGILTLSGGAPARSPGGKLNPSYKIERLQVLTPGKYHMLVSGVVCNTCTRAIVENLKALKGVEEASFDFEEGVLWLTVKKDAQVRASKVARAVVHAGRRVKLGTRFRVTEVRLAE